VGCSCLESMRIRFTGRRSLRSFFFRKTGSSAPIRLIHSRNVCVAFIFCLHAVVSEHLRMSCVCCLAPSGGICKSIKILFQKLFGVQEDDSSISDTVLTIAASLRHMKHGKSSAFRPFTAVVPRPCARGDTSAELRADTIQKVPPLFLLVFKCSLIFADLSPLMTACASSLIFDDRMCLVPDL
jgi:hypothetical protein